jgi:hypothetical protein
MGSCRRVSAERPMVVPRRSSHAWSANCQRQPAADRNAKDEPALHDDVAADQKESIDGELT